MPVMTDETIGDRLIRLADAHPDFAGLTRTALAERLGMSYETLRKWQANQSGPSRRRADEIAGMLGVPTETLTHGVTYVIPEASSREISPVVVSLQAQPVSQDSVNMSPRPRLPSVGWRDEKMIQAHKRFSVTAPDDTMAPVILRGATAVFDTTLLPARNGDVVLLKDMAGDWHIREYQGTPDGSWHALPLKDRALTLDSSKHGLSVLAVFDGTIGRRG
jgi:transcriptional regulator with XRE-family HTH domain